MNRGLFSLFISLQKSKKRKGIICPFHTFFHSGSKRISTQFNLSLLPLYLGSRRQCTGTHSLESCAK